MEIGSKVTCMDATQSKKLYAGSVYTIDDTRYDNGLELHFEELSGRNWYKADRFIPQVTQVNNQPAKEINAMNNETIRKSCIADGDTLEVSEKLQSNFGPEISSTFGNDTHTGALFFKANKKNYLAEIKVRDDKAEADKAKAVATKALADSATQAVQNA